MKSSFPQADPIIQGEVNSISLQENHKIILLPKTSLLLPRNHLSSKVVLTCLESSSSSRRRSQSNTLDSEM